MWFELNGGHAFRSLQKSAFNSLVSPDIAGVISICDDTVYVSQMCT